MTANDRPSPPAPAAEDDAVEKAVRAFYQTLRSADPDGWATAESVDMSHWHGPIRAALDAAGMTALRASADEWWTLYDQELRRGDEARQQVADLRARIEALAERCERIDPRWWVSHEVRALLAGSGEQPGETHPRDCLCNDEAPTLLAGGLPTPSVYCERAKGHEPPHAASDMTWSRPTPVVPGLRIEGSTPDGLGGRTFTTGVPVVPDSTGLRERVAQAVDDITDAVLAVVGQGVTADLAEYRAALAENPDAVVWDLPDFLRDMDDWIENQPNLRADVRSGEQGGE